MTSTRRLAPLSLALCLALSSGAAFAAPAQKGESTVKSFGQAFRAGVQAYKERRAEAGPGIVKRSLIKTGQAIGTGAAATKAATVAVGSGIKSAGVAVGHGVKAGTQATVRVVRNSLVARMTIGIADGLRATGRVIARPFKRIAAAIRAEKASIQTARVEKIAGNEALGLRELETMAQQGKISQRTKLAVIDARSAAPISREKAIVDHLTTDSNVGLRDLEAKAQKGEITHEMKQAVIDARLASPTSRASLVTE